MAVLKILEYPDPRLRTKAQPVTAVTAEHRLLADNMFETMYAAPGIGLAATQVDQHIRLLVLDVSEGRDQPLCFITRKS
jgi:peptide deformylase